jgi:hypothetical protein
VRNAQTDSSVAPALPSQSSVAERLRACRTPQLDLSIQVLGGQATVVVRHVRGDPCRLRRLPLKLTVRDESGRKLQLRSPEGLESFKQPITVRGDFSPGFEQLIAITSARCTPEVARLGHFFASARAGPYVAHRVIAGGDICIGG